MGLKIDSVGPNLGFKAEDFVCSELVRTAPLGGVNEASYDTTAVDNMPPCVCNSCGGRNRMVPMWAYISRMPDLARQGIIPVPAVCFENDYRGGYPVRPRSGTFFIRDGRGMRDPGTSEVVLYMMTCENKARLRKNDADATDRQRYGRAVRHVDIKKGIVGESNRTVGWEGEDEDKSQAWNVEKTRDGVVRSKKPIPIDITP